MHKLINKWRKNNAKITKIALFKQPEIESTCSKTLSNSYKNRRRLDRCQADKMY